MVRVKVSCERCGKEFTTKTTKIKDDSGKKIHVPQKYVCRRCEIFQLTGRPPTPKVGRALTEAERLKEMQILSRRVNIARRLQLRRVQTQETEDHIKLLSTHDKMEDEKNEEN